MCEICGRRYCAPACPAYMGRRIGSGRIRAKCKSCGRELFVSDSIIRKNEAILCVDCADSFCDNISDGTPPC